jgi:hypothetical protein
MCEHFRVPRPDTKKPKSIHVQGPHDVYVIPIRSICFLHFHEGDVYLVLMNGDQVQIDERGYRTVEKLLT